MTSGIFHFDGCVTQAGALATALGISCDMVTTRNFPDGESLVRAPAATETSLLYRSLDNPNIKLVEIILAAAALRDMGAKRVILIAPYLAYMRQDIAFRPGEAVSQRVIGNLIADHFDGVVTVDPHLHRITHLGQAIPGIPALALSAAPALSGALEPELSPILIGPDAESRPWVEAIARPRSLPVLVGEKHRKGDRDVSLSIPGIACVAGQAVVLVDDVISSGQTLIEAAQVALEAGAASVEAMTTHCLATPPDLARMNAAGIRRIRSTDTITGPTATLPIAPLLAQAIREQGWST